MAQKKNPGMTAIRMPNLRQLVAVIPWGHNLVILNSLKDAVMEKGGE